METLRVGPPLDKAIDIGAIVAPVQLERIRALVAKGVERGRRALSAAKLRCPTGGASSRRRWSPTSRRLDPARKTRSSGRCWSTMTLPHARRGGGARQQHRATASPPASGARIDQPRARRRAAAQGRRRLDQLDQPVRRRRRLRRLSRIGLRPRGRPRGHVRVSEAAWREDEASGSRREGRTLERNAEVEAAR